MQKGALISLALGSINGGLTSADSSVTENEVEAYMPDAIGYVLLVQYRNQLRVDDSRDLPEDFFYPQFLTVTKDAFGVAQATFPVRPLSIEKNRGIRYVGPLDNSDKYIIQIEGAVTAYKYYANTIDNCLITVRVEHTSTGTSIFLKNLPDSVKQLKTLILPNPIDLQDEDELPMPAGFAIDVMNQIVTYFTTQRQDPRDYIEDQKDANADNIHIYKQSNK